MSVYHNNLHHAQKLQNQANDKDTKPRKYTQGDKV